MRAAKTLVSLRICVGSPETSLVDNAISACIMISCLSEQAHIASVSSKRFDEPAHLHNSERDIFEPRYEKPVILYANNKKSRRTV